jgi:CRISPR-associated protein Csx10
VTTREPVRISRAVLGNLIQGCDHVPGTMLMAWLLRRLGSPATLRQAMAVGDAVITNAVPEVDGVPGRPAPMALHAQKSSDVLHNALTAAVRDGSPLRAGWVPACTTDTGTDVRVLTGATGFITHNVVTVRSGRPTSDDGGLYTAEVIPAGTVLRAALRLRGGVHARLVADLGADWVGRLPGEARLGTAAKSEYGQVDIAVGAAWAPTGPDVPGPAHGRGQPTGPVVLTVWALSDILVRDARLRLSGRVADVVTALADRLGVRLEIDRDGESAAVGVTRIESWQSSWRLPRPSLVGLAAGSCLRLRVTGGVPDPAALLDIEAGGLGERRGEGFGQVAFHAPLLRRDRVRRVPVKPVQRSPAGGRVPADADDAAYLAVVQRAAFVELLGVQVRVADADQARVPLVAALRESTPSQRGALRELVAAVRGPGGARRLDAFLARRDQRKHLRRLVGVLAGFNAADRLGFLLDPVRQALALEPDMVPPQVWRDALGLLVLDALAEVEADEATARAAPTGRASTDAGPVTEIADRPAAPVTPPPAAPVRPTRQRGTPNGRRQSPRAPTSAPQEYRRVHARWELTATLVARTPLHVGGCPRRPLPGPDGGL